VITLADVQSLVAIESVSRNERALADHVELALASNPALEVTRIGDNVVARTLRGSATRLLVAGHLDTVPGDASLSEIKGDVLWGLGACDMKASLAAMLHVAVSTHEGPHDVTYVFYAREEISREESGLLEIHHERFDLLRADAAVVAEPTNGGIEAGCQGTLRVGVTLVGQRAHTARPFTGRNAIHRLAPLLERVASYEPREVTIDDVTYVEQLQAVLVDGGIAANVVPDRVRVTLNHRVAPDRDDAQAAEWLAGFLGETLEEGDGFVILDWAPAAVPALGNEHLGRLLALSGVPARAKVGWTDVATLQSLGVPATNCGAGDPLLAHHPDEHVREADLQAFTSLLARWLAGDS